MAPISGTIGHSASHSDDERIPVRRSRQPVLLAVGRSAGGSYASVARRMLTPLAGRWNVHLFGIDDRGPERNDCGLTVHTAPSRNWITRLGELLSTLRPQAVFVIHDLVIGCLIAEVLERADHRPPALAYLTVEGPLLRPELAAAASVFDHVAVPSRVSATELERCLRIQGRSGPTVRVIPHGVLVHSRNGVYASRAEARKRMFPNAPQDGFWVLNANAVNPRKNLETTLWEFADFARTRPDARLCMLRLRPGIDREGDKLLELARRLGIRDRLLQPETGDRDWLTDEELDLVYAAFQVGVNTSMGEGWGMVSMEHAAAGAAQIVPGHGTCLELWDGAALLLEPGGVTDYAGVYEMRGILSARLTDALIHLYEQPDFLEEMAQRALMRSREFPSWTEVSSEIETLLSQALTG